MCEIIAKQYPAYYIDRSTAILLAAKYWSILFEMEADYQTRDKLFSYAERRNEKERKNDAQKIEESVGW